MNVLKESEQLNQKHIRHRRWLSVLTVLSALVVFVTTYAMILPAITWDRMLICEREEHTHGDFCWEDGVLICEKEEHIHDDSCFDAPPAPDEDHVCGMIEHLHNDYCYFADGTLRCTIPEHVHTLDCLPEEEREDRSAFAYAAVYDSDLVQEEDPWLLLDPDEEGEGENYVFATYPAVQRRMLMAFASPPSPNAIVLDAYLNAERTALEYSLDGLKTWTDVSLLPTDGLPGDAVMRLKIGFADIPYQTLVNAEYQLTYTVPDTLRNLYANNEIKSDGAVVGTLELDGRDMLVTLNPSWVEDKITITYDDLGREIINYPNISGSFYVYGGLNLSDSDEDNRMTITIGPNEYEVVFEEDVVEKYSEVHLDKSDPILVQDPDGTDYLSYSLTVTTGPDPITDLVVYDAIEDLTNVVGYDSLSPEMGTATAPTVEELVWTIGDMAANDSETLTYLVELEEGYIGGEAGDVIVNNADLYADEYKRDSDSATFAPTAAVSVSKSANTFHETEDGGYYLYTVTVTAGSENTYPLDNVVITDALDGSIPGSNTAYVTPSDLRAYLSYDTDWSGTSSDWQIKRGSVTSRLTADNDVTFTSDANGDGLANEGFSAVIGTMVPGEKVVLTYRLDVDPGIYPALGNETGNIKNVAAVSLEDDRDPIQYANNDRSFGSKKWSRKLAGERIEEPIEFTIPTTDAVFDATGASVVPMTNPGSYTVPAGSYLYQIAANEAGDWNLSSTAMNDAFSDTFMQYEGFVRVDAYAINANAPASSLSDGDALANLQSRDPIRTVYVNVDGAGSFSFTPGELGLTDTYAYVLSYYAKPYAVGSMANPAVTNSFGMTGTGTYNGESYPITGITADIRVTVQTDDSFYAEKLGWYYATAYEDPLGATGDFSKGVFYWVIKVDGNVRVGTKLKDVTKSTQTYFRAASLAGVYTGELPQSVTSYASLSELLATGLLTEVSSDSYSIKYYTSSALTTEVPLNQLGSNPTKSAAAVLSVDRDIPLDPGESIYVILRTAIGYLSPTSNSGGYAYVNSLSSSVDNGENWSDPQEAKLTVTKNKYLYKTGYTGAYTGNALTGTLATYVKDQTPFANGTVDRGTYVGWRISIDHRDNMGGSFRVIDSLPAEVTPEFLSVYKLSNSFESRFGTPLQFRQIPSDEWPDGSWVEHSTTMNGYLVSNKQTLTPFTVYWYTDSATNRVMFDVDGFGYPAGISSAGLELILGCRVSDPDMLLGEYSKTLNNKVELYKPDPDDPSNDQKLDESNASVTVQKETLSKVGNYNVLDGNYYPFEITLNPLGEDLSPQSDTVRVIDENSETMVPDPTTIHVYDITNEANPVELTPDEDWTLDIGEESMEFIVPDEIKLKIVYQMIINAPPGKPVHIWNSVHYDGYTPPPDSQFDVDEFSFAVGGDIEGTPSPKIRLVKANLHHPLQYLEHAFFRLEEYRLEDDGETLTFVRNVATGETDENGQILFGENEILSTDTVYHLTETEAPIGFMRDTEGQFFVIAKRRADGTYRDYPDNVTFFYYESPSNPVWVVRMYNDTVEYGLPATGGHGELIFYGAGLLLIAGSLVTARHLCRRARRSKTGN